MFASGPSPAVAYQLSLKLGSLRLLPLDCLHSPWNRRRCRAPHPPARAPLARTRPDGTLGVMGGGTGVARWVGEWVRCATPSVVRVGRCCQFRVCHHPCSFLHPSYCHIAFRAPVIGRIPPSCHSYRPRTTLSTVAAPISNPRFSPLALARLPLSTYPVPVRARRALRRRVSSYPRAGPSVSFLFSRC